jgi:hypothetical protein
MTVYTPNYSSILSSKIKNRKLISESPGTLRHTLSPFKSRLSSRDDGGAVAMRSPPSQGLSALEDLGL